MNNIINIYELLGLIKDGKAPKKIKWEDYIFSFYNDDYLCRDEDFVKNRETNYLLCYLFSLPGSVLNNKVEILNDFEEDKPIIKKINIESDSPTHFYIRNEYGTKCSLTKHSKMIADKLNEIIDYINRKEDK